MRDVLSPLRKAYWDNIQPGLAWQGNPIPVCEEYLNEPPAVIIDQEGRRVELYVIIGNQTSNDISAKCGRDDESSIQIRIVASYPSGTGGSRLPEQIGDIIKAGIFQKPGGGHALEIESPFDIWKCQFLSSRNLNYETDNSREWTHVMIINNWVSQ